MSVTLFVGPLIDPEEENQQEIARLKAILDDLNAQLAERGLPAYRDPEAEPEGYEFWNVMFANEWMANLMALLDNVRADEQSQIKLRQFVDAGETGAHYFPIDFPEPLKSTVAEDMVYGSCQALLREVEALGEWLGVPLERFPMDFSGEFEDQGSKWAAIFEELEEQGAPFINLTWGGVSLEAVEDHIREICEATGADLDAFKQSLIEEYGSLEAYVEAMNAEGPSDAENTMGAVFALVSYYQGCKYAIAHGLTFGGG